MRAAVPSSFLFLTVGIITSLILLINVSFKIIIVQGLVFTTSSLLCPLIAVLYLFVLRHCNGIEQRHVLNVALMSLYAFCIGVYVLVNLPAAEYMHDNPVYQIIFEDIPKKFFATTIAFALSFYVPHWLLSANKNTVLRSAKHCVIVSLFGGLSFFCIHFYLLFSHPHAHSFKQIFIDSFMISSLLLLFIAVCYMTFVLHDKDEFSLSKKSKSESTPLYYYLICFAVTILLISLACEYRIVALSKNMVLAASCIFFPMTLMISTFIDELWGYRANLKLILVLIATQFIFDGLLMGIVALPSPPFFNLNPFYNYIMPRRLPAAFFALFVSFGCNALLLHYLKRTQWGANQTLRILFANICANSLLCIIDYGVLFGGIYPYEQIINLVVNVWQYKLLMTLLSLPVVRWCCHKKYRLQATRLLHN